jgi:hypothetical protein
VQNLVARLNRLFFRNRTNSPFLSGDTFSTLTDFKIANPADLPSSRTISSKSLIFFCKSELVERLIDLVSKVEGNFTLIAGNSDRNFGQEIFGLTRVFVRSFLQNSTISDNKCIFTLPIGIENIRLGVNGIPRYMKPGISWRDRNKKVLVGPFSMTNPSRRTLMEDSSFLHPDFTKYDSFLSPKTYAQIVCSHKYVLCPAGNGIDTHRFWEALYRGAVPIVLKTSWSQSLRIHNIPMLEVSDFSSESIIESTESFENSLDSDFDPRKTKALWIDYWKSFFRK